MTLHELEVQQHILNDPKDGVCVYVCVCLAGEDGLDGESLSSEPGLISKRMPWTDGHCSAESGFRVVWEELLAKQ